MLIREIINVKDDRLLDGLTPVVRIMLQIEESQVEEPVTIDFSQTSFISPVFALSFIIYISRCKRNVSFCNVPDYIEIIGLNNGGIRPDQMRQTEFLALLEKYALKTYIPIINFSANRNSDAKMVTRTCPLSLPCHSGNNHAFLGYRDGSVFQVLFIEYKFGDIYNHG